MTKYREILRLKSLGFSERNIALSVPCSRNTVSKVIKLANEMNISWPLPEGTTDADLEKQFKSPASTTTAKRMPDYDYIRKELLKNGVTKKLLWTDLYKVSLNVGELYYPNMTIIVNQDLDTPFNLILSATMFQNLIYEVDDKNHRMNIMIPDEESMVRSLRIEDSGGQIHILCNSA